MHQTPETLPLDGVDDMKIITEYMFGRPSHDETACSISKTQEVVLYVTTEGWEFPVVHIVEIYLLLQFIPNALNELIGSILSNR